MEKARHLEESLTIFASPEAIFAYADDHRNFSAHMNQSSWMMGGSKMETNVDAGEGRKVGSHITMNGRVFGVNLFLDEVITVHEPPRQKEWQTVGNINLVVIDHYTLGFKISPDETGFRFTVYIDYDLPKSWKTKALGILFGGMYAKWCVRQMTQGVYNHFANQE